MLAYVLSGLLCGLVALVASRLLWAGIAATAAGTLAGWLFLPTLAVDFRGLPMIAVLGATVGVLATLVSQDKGRQRQAVIVTALASLYLLLAPLTGAHMFRAGAYHDLLGRVDTLTNAPDVAPVDPARVLLVDAALAGRLAERKLGEQGALGSQVEIGDMHLSVVRGEWFWIAPLNHSGFLRWLNQRSGTPGYVMVSGSNSRDVRLVTRLEGRPLQVRHNAGAFLGDDPIRYLYANGYATRGVTDYTFETDDEGRPFIVATLFKNRVGFGGRDAVGAVILDVQTGGITECATARCPEWVDLIQPVEFVVAQANDWGRYVRGYLKSWTGQEMLRTTGGVSRVLDRQGRLHYYLGITSVNADRGTTGYMLVDTRTKKAAYYRQAGATEDAAMAAAQGSVQEKGYQAGFPTPYNVGGAWTYLVPLKAQDGLVRAVSFVLVENDQVMGTGDDVHSALRKYRQALASRGTTFAADQQTTRTVVRARIARLGVDLRGGDTYYYLTLEGHPEVAFVAGSSLSPELPLTREGDEVSVAYEEGGRGVVDLASYDNLALAFRSSAPEARVQAADGIVRTRVDTERAATSADAKWERMTPAERARVLEPTVYPAAQPAAAARP